MAGNGSAGYYGDGGPATLAAFNLITSVVVDGSGDLYIADAGIASYYGYYNSAIRRVDGVTGIVTTVLSPGLTGGMDGNLGFSPASTLALDSAGNLYFEPQNPNSPTLDSIQQWNPATGSVTTVATLAGGGTLVAVDALGNLYVSNPAVGPIQILRVDALTGNITAVISAKQPSGLALDGRGNLYIAEALNNTVQRVDALTGAVTTVGSGLNGPAGIAADAFGNVYVANTNDNQVLFVDMVTPPGAVFSNVPQTIFFPLIGVTTYPETLNIVAIASSGLPVTLVSNTPAVCTVSGAETVSFVMPGQCLLTASQMGNATYAAAIRMGLRP